MSATPGAAFPLPPSPGPAPALPPPPLPVPYRIPSLGYRLTIGSFRFLLWVIALVIVPVAVLGYLQKFSLGFPISIDTEVVYGLVLSALLTARYVVKPTRAYGPVGIAAAAVTIAFFVTLLLQATYHLSVPQTPLAISVVFARFVELLLIVPSLSLLAALVTTIEDLRFPTERLEFDFPL